MDTFKGILVGGGALLLLSPWVILLAQTLTQGSW